jgi:T-complex protein 1 subunit beta
VKIADHAGFILDKQIATNSPKRIENAKILIANTCELHYLAVVSRLGQADIIAMDTDKIKIFGARVRVDGTGKLAELERAEKVCPLPRVICPPATLLSCSRYAYHRQQQTR